MAQNYIGWEALDAQLRWVSDVATRVAIVSTYARGDTYEDLLPRILVYHHVSESPLFGAIYDDIEASGADANAPNRVLPYLGSGVPKIAVGDNGGGSDTALVIVQDNQQRILFVINERYNKAIALNDPITIQPFRFMATQHEVKYA
jgi:hypothetical protein